jgi:acetyl-CoA synthetase
MGQARLEFVLRAVDRRVDDRVYNYARFDAARFLTMLRHANVTSLCTPPTVWRMLIQADLGAKPAALREAVGAGEPLNPEVIAHVQKRSGLTIRDGFGQTETPALIGNTSGSPVKPGSMGRPLPVPRLRSSTASAGSRPAKARSACGSIPDR